MYNKLTWKTIMLIYIFIALAHQQRVAHQQRGGGGSSGGGSFSSGGGSFSSGGGSFSSGGSSSFGRVRNYHSPFAVIEAIIGSIIIAFYFICTSSCCRNLGSGI